MHFTYERFYRISVNLGVIIREGYSFLPLFTMQITLQIDCNMPVTELGGYSIPTLYLPCK